MIYKMWDTKTRTMLRWDIPGFEAREERHYGHVANIPCLICTLYENKRTDSMVHHKIAGVAKGKKAPPWWTFPLCFRHHQDGGPGVAIHADRPLWEKVFEREDHFIEIINRYLIKHNLWEWEGYVEWP